jgi:ABC-2 type transport system ATP-binding protein
LVGPNGSGKSTLMNIICGVVRPSRGRATVFGQPIWNNAELKRRVGYCSQVDKFFERFTGLQFLRSLLLLHGRGGEWADRMARAALGRLGLTEAMHQRLSTYSKGMRQRTKVALALAHQPEALVLDEPFNGLDPVGRREMMKLLQDYARDGRTIVLSSHILHEVEQMTDHLLMMSNGYVMAEGQIGQVRELLKSHPFQIFVRCDSPRRLASLMLAEPGVRGAVCEDETSVTLTAVDPDGFYDRFHEVVLEHDIEVDLVTLADENAQSIYRYLSGREHRAPRTS